ncbi:c-type cytochrome [Phenylobacterium sp.]|uniref:c-type cytochrome n=1 Tax=Phenylobacterium sp. TaxID=1871053 RepID=UPI002DF56C8E|nr:c-type cytochrome [Phenylobacterium sp.]
MKPAGLIRALAAAGTLILVASACAGGPKLPPPPAQTFERAEIERGAGLAKLGDCQGCHTADGGVAYAGGRPLKTPFGTLYATNITPDRETGLGRYTKEAFVRAMRRGVRADGAHLYPAFPYDHFAYADDRDLDALYAFLMTRRPVVQTAPANRLIPPANIRSVLAIWKALFFHPGPPAAPDPNDEQARGAYLVQSLGHCGACHTPHNVLGAEDRKRGLDGGYQEGWYAPPLNALSPASAAWTPEGLERYFKTGLDRDHAAAAGPMGTVVRELARAPDADLHAMAVYLAQVMRPSPAGQGRAALVDRAEAAQRAHPEGASLYAGACATCHEPGAPMMLEGRPPLPLGTPLHEADPRDVLQIVLQGLKPPLGGAGPYMPAFASSLTDRQVAEIAAYVRARYSDRPPWPDLTAAVAKARKEGAS